MFGVALFTVPYGYSTLLKMLMSDYRFRPEIQDVTELTLPGQEYLWNFRIRESSAPDPGKTLLRRRSVVRAETHCIND